MHFTLKDRYTEQGAALNDLEKITKKRQITEPLKKKYSSELHRIISEVLKLPILSPTSVEVSRDFSVLVNRLQKDLQLIIDRLFESDFDNSDITYFKEKFEKTIGNFETLFEHEPTVSIPKIMYYNFIRPLFMGLMGSIIGLVISPILPFSSSARHYVGSFFNSPLRNELDKEFSKILTIVDEDLLTIRTQL